MSAAVNKQTLNPAHALSDPGMEPAQPADATELGTLAYVVVHDLNNLLTPILSLTELVRAGLAQDDSNQPALLLVCQATRQAKGLVDRILASRHGSPHAFRETDLSVFLLSLLPLFRESMPKTIELRHQIELVPAILADSDQIYQAISNLVVNAAQAIGPKPGIISIGLSTIDHSSGSMGEMVRVTVSDSGPGMDKEIREHIFEPFFTTRRKLGGQGLGLAIVRWVAEAHGGMVGVDSKPGAGTCFEICLPLPENR
jgi:signal transduction histidine kinase